MRAKAIGLKEGQAIGLKEGQAIGQAAILLRLLERRFPHLSPDVRADAQARVPAATTEQLERWAERVLDAESLDDVFG